MLKNIIFDLDGTLIDSSSSILASFDAAFRKLGMSPKRELTPEIIGPPLMQTLAALAGSQDEEVLLAMAQQFKLHYDSDGYKATTVFAGVPDMLQELAASPARLYIATNKRINPTRSILDYLGWTAWFEKIYALDVFTPALPSKKRMIGQILQDESMRLDETIYIGDRFEDGEAAEINGLQFAMVTWGYNDGTVGELPQHWPLYTSPQELGQQLRSRN